MNVHFPNGANVETGGLCNFRRSLAVVALLIGAIPWAVAQDLSVSMSDSPDPANAGDLIIYIIDMTNSGASADNVAVSLPTPTNAFIVNAEVLSGSGWTLASPANPVQFTKGTVGASETAQFRVRVKIGNGVSAGTIITATASVSTTSSDPVPQNNSASATTTVSTAADLAVNIADTPDPVDPGANLVYDYTVANFGPSDATNVVVTLPVPAGTTFVQAVGPVGGTWTLGAPPAGQTGNVTFSKATVAFQEGGIFKLTVNVNGNATGTIDAQVTVTSDTAEANPGDETLQASTTVTAQGSPTGAYRGKILPKLAWKEGAQWRIEIEPGVWSAWKNHREVVSGLTPGVHTVEFSTFSGWDAPADIDVNIVADKTTVKSGVYLKWSSVLVTLGPSGARADGALWRVSTGGGQWSKWKKSNQIETDLTPGTHTIECMDITGWITPSDRDVSVSATVGTKSKRTYELSK